MILIYHEKILNIILSTPEKVTNPNVKAWILVFGSCQDIGSVWNNGNAVSKHFKKISDFLEDNYDDIYNIDKFKEIRKNYSHWTYREPRANRHGHCNELPSWWTLGYATIDAYKNDIGINVFEKYMEARELNKEDRAQKYSIDDV